LGNFGRLNGEFGTVERANDKDAVVKWDVDSRKRINQPSLKKILARNRCSRWRAIPLWLFFLECSWQIDHLGSTTDSCKLKPCGHHGKAADVMWFALETKRKRFEIVRADSPCVE
jgi:hypothetical protein